MATTVKLNSVQTPAVPQLPTPPTAYDQNQQNQLNNVLRLYFQQLNTVVSVNSNNIASNSVLTWLNL
jgi:hypothetical protein